MQPLIASALVLAVATLPAGAATRRGRTVHHHAAEVGMPITAERDSIRINSVGQVISQPVPVIEKEKNFDSRAHQELSKPLQRPNSGDGVPPQP